MMAMATKLTAKPKDGDEDSVAQDSIPVMPDSSLPEASASTFSYSSMPPTVDPLSPSGIHQLEIGSGKQLVLDSDDEDVDEVPLVDSPPPLPRPGGSWPHSSSPPLYTPLEQSPSSRCTADLHNSMDTPPPPP
jgi:hypothetical protein